MVDETQQTSQSSSAGQTQQSSQSGAAQGSTSATQTQSSSQKPADGQTGQTQQTQAPVRPAYIPETHWDATAGKVKDEAKFAEEINGNAAAVAAERSRRLTLPQTPEAYKDDLPSSFTPPAGLEFKIDTADPLIAQYRTLAHKAGLDQATYSEGLGLIAALRVGEATEMKKAYDGEIAKLGASGPARVDAAVQWLNAMGGPEAKSLTDVFKVAPVANTVIAVENLMKKFTSQGVTPMSQAHRADAPPAGKIPGYEKMDFTQKRLAQDKLRLGAR